MNTCNCVNHQPVACLAKRSNASETLTECIGKCECRCHTPQPGMLITNAQWQDNRKRMARPGSPTQDKNLAPWLETFMREARP